MAVVEYEVLNRKKTNVVYLKERHTLIIKERIPNYKYYLLVRDFDKEENEYYYYILLSSHKFDENCIQCTYDDYGRLKIHTTIELHNYLMTKFKYGEKVNFEYKDSNDSYNKYAIV